MCTQRKRAQKHTLQRLVLKEWTLQPTKLGCLVLFLSKKVSLPKNLKLETWHQIHTPKENAIKGLTPTAVKRHRPWPSFADVAPMQSSRPPKAELEDGSGTSGDDQWFEGVFHKYQTTPFWCIKTAWRDALHTKATKPKHPYLHQLGMLCNAGAAPCCRSLTSKRNVLFEWWRFWSSIIHCLSWVVFALRSKVSYSIFSALVGSRLASHSSTRSVFCGLNILGCNNITNPKGRIKFKYPNGAWIQGDLASSTT